MEPAMALAETVRDVGKRNAETDLMADLAVQSRGVASTSSRSPTETAKTAIRRATRPRGPRGCR